MTGRNLRVTINKQPDPNALVSLGQTSIRERLLRFLFGPLTDIALIVPGHKVSDLTISRKPDASQPEEQPTPAPREETPEERLVKAIFGEDHTPEKDDAVWN